MVLPKQSRNTILWIAPSLRQKGVLQYQQKQSQNYFMNFSQNLTSSPNNTERTVDLSPSPSKQAQNSEQNSEIKPTKTRINSKTNSTKIHYNWNKIEEKRYINFLALHSDLFELTRDQRKCLKINVLMEKSIGSRSAAQCHTHHQKMMIKFGSIDNIIRAHLHIATKRLMPKRFIQHVKPEKQKKKLQNRETQANEEVSVDQRDNSKPYWLGFANLESSDPFFGFPMFPNDEASSLI